MASWEKSEIILDDGLKVPAQAPVIVSASRSTDIPAFYADWFLHRLKKGYSAWTNPFNGVKSYVSYANMRFVVFWSKNPRPLIESGILDYLAERNIGCYVQYSLNDYEAEGLEKGVKPLDYRIETFRMLVERLGKGAVVWRFDPLILTDTVDIDLLLEKIKRIELNGSWDMKEGIETPFEYNLKYHRDSKENFEQRINWVKEILENNND